MLGRVDEISKILNTLPKSKTIMIVRQRLMCYIKFIYCYDEKYYNHCHVNQCSVCRQNSENSTHSVLIKTKLELTWEHGFVAERLRQSPYFSDIASSNPG